MKRILFVLFSFFVFFSGKAADIYVSCCVNGIWAKWEYAYRANVYGGYSGFSIAYSDAQNWDWFIRFNIDNYYVPTKDQMKWYKKNNKWIEYSGTVEYYVTEDYPTIDAVMRSMGAYLVPPRGKRIK